MLKETEYNKPWIGQRADPFVMKAADGSYYFTASVPEYDRIILRKSSTVAGLADAQEKVVWTKHNSGLMSKHVWAPELHYLNGGWYIYFAAGEEEDIWAIRPYVLHCKGQDPMLDEWEECGKMQCADDDEFSFRSFSLDATVFENRGNYYYVWAEKVGVGRQISNLYIAQMESPTKLKTVQVLLVTPDYDWERVDFWVAEGPAVVKHDNKKFKKYSASAKGACYCVGLMSASQEDDLLDPCSWRKSRVPVLKTDPEKGIYGPGHNCFVKSEDGLKDIMVFHARQYKEITGDPLYDPNRHAMLLEVKWGQDGMPCFEFEKCKF